ncbi:MAG: hypothetical protein MJ240_12515 [Kiritimatiellae bacterium]|nr:hypothetical protein [Kiritimatiellia bacterium]
MPNENETEIAATANDTIDLDRLAAKIPHEYEPHWIAKLVSAFAGARGVGKDNDELLDYWQEALRVATRALADAEAKGGNATAFVKHAVRHALSKCNAAADRRHDAVTLLSALPDDNDPEAAPRPIEEMGESAFSRSDRHRLNAVHAALMIVLGNPRHARYWEAFRQSRGSDREVASLLGIASHHTVRTRYAAPFRADFAAALAIVRCLRRRAGGKL